MGLSWHELLIIAVVAILVIPPRQLPEAARAAGSWIARIKRLANDFQRQLTAAVRDEETEKLARDLTQFGNRTGTDIRKALSVDDSERVRQRLRELTEFAPEHPSAAAPKPVPSTEPVAPPGAEAAPP